jgi:hypothetical protein
MLASGGLCFTLLDSIRSDLTIVESGNRVETSRCLGQNKNSVRCGRRVKPFNKLSFDKTDPAVWDRSCHLQASDVLKAQDIK